MQDDVRKKFPKLSDVLVPDEYIEYCFKGGRLPPWGYFAVTEKRLLLRHKPRLFGAVVLEEHDWSEVVAIGDIRSDSLGVRLLVQTLKGDVNLHFMQDEIGDAHRVQSEIAAALNRHNAGQRDIHALIWSLDLSGKE